MRFIFILMLVTGEPKSEHNGKEFKLVYKGQMSFGWVEWVELVFFACVYFFKVGLVNNINLNVSHGWAQVT